VLRTSTTIACSIFLSRSFSIAASHQRCNTSRQPDKCWVVPQLAKDEPKNVVPPRSNSPLPTGPDGLFFWRGDGCDRSAMIALVNDELGPLRGLWQRCIVRRPASAFHANGRGSLVNFLRHRFVGPISYCLYLLKYSGKSGNSIYVILGNGVL
jgi:hypothetical protein